MERIKSGLYAGKTMNQYRLCLACVSRLKDLLHPIDFRFRRITRETLAAGILNLDYKKDEASFKDGIPG